MKDIYGSKRQEIRQIYKGLEKFTPVEDREKNKAILEEYMTTYLKEAQERRQKKVTNILRVFDNMGGILKTYRRTLSENTKTRGEQGSKDIEGTKVISGLLKKKLKDAINSTWIPD